MNKAKCNCNGNGKCLRSRRAQQSGIPAYTAVSPVPVPVLCSLLFQLPRRKGGGGAKGALAPPTVALGVLSPLPNIGTSSKGSGIFVQDVLQSYKTSDSALIRLFQTLLIP